tara:strand:+ start:41 stop:232 length:192 start_codon:yes stop_codon:yes gene_type:complete
MEENKEQKEEKVEKKKEGLEMDDKNKKAFNVFLEEGNQAFVKHVFTSENGGQLSYSEMRMMYG